MKKIALFALLFTQSSMVLAENYIKCEFQNKQFILHVYFSPDYEYIPRDTNFSNTIGTQTAMVFVHYLNNTPHIAYRHNNVSHLYDGHLSGILTAPGFSLKYENHYGEFKRVHLSTIAGFSPEINQWADNFYADECQKVSL